MTTFAGRLRPKPAGLPARGVDAGVSQAVRRPSEKRPRRTKDRTTELGGHELSG